MQTLTTGPSRERVVRTVLLFLLVVGFAAAYLWDGYVGYARKNTQELLQLLGLTDQPLPPMAPRLTAAWANRIAGEVKPGDPTPSVTSELGEPGLRHGSDAYYVGPGGWLKITSDGGRVASIAWVDGGRTESDQKWQRWIGFALCAAGVLVLLQLARVARTRLSLTDSGLHVGKLAPIRPAAITAMHIDPPGAVGCVDVHYTDAGRPAALRLDPYTYRDVGPIVTELQKRKAFPGPG